MMFTETRRWLTISIYARLPGIAAVVSSGLGLSEALPAGDVWKGAWKFESDRQDRPFLTYSGTGGKTVFRIGCGTHFEMYVVYPAPPRLQPWPGQLNVRFTSESGRR